MMHFSDIDQHNDVRHVLGLSGGKDSAALAVYIKDRYPEISKKWSISSLIQVQIKRNL